MSVAFDGMDNLVVTFRCSGTVDAAVQIRGYVTLPYTGTAPALGWQELVTNGSQGLRTVTTGEAGKACLVVRVDAATSTLGLFL